MSARVVKKNRKKTEPRYRRQLVLEIYQRGLYHYTKIGNTTLCTIAIRMQEAGAPRRGRYRLTITRDPAGDWTCHGTYIERHTGTGFSSCYMRRYRWGPTPFLCTVTFRSLSKSARKP